MVSRQRAQWGRRRLPPPFLQKRWAFYPPLQRRTTGAAVIWEVWAPARPFVTLQTEEKEVGVGVHLVEEVGGTNL